jgi:hypothetical protein
VRLLLLLLLKILLQLLPLTRMVIRSMQMRWWRWWWQMGGHHATTMIIIRRLLLMMIMTCWRTASGARSCKLEKVSMGLQPQGVVRIEARITTATHGQVVLMSATTTRSTTPTT